MPFLADREGGEAPAKVDRPGLPTWLAEPFVSNAHGPALFYAEPQTGRRLSGGPGMKTVLITGAAGNVGSQLRSEFAGRYKLRLSDKRLLRPSAGNVEAGPSNVL